VPNALQCPACGHKHRLTTLSGDPIFTCTSCGRLLKLPAEFRQPAPSASTEAPRPSASARVTRGGVQRRDPVAPPPGAPRATPAAATPRPRPRGRPTTDMALPLRILAWVVAIGLGGLIVRWFARITGWLTGDSLIDLITGSGILRYVRIFTVVPFWALVSAGLATLFIEGGRYLARRRDAVAGKGPRPVRAAAPAAARTTPKVKAEPKPKVRKPAAARNTPAPEPAPAPVQAPPPAAPAPSVRSTKPVVPRPAADGRAPSSATEAPRPRRIPRRDVPS
jgi:hypothetical protein